MTLMPSVSPVIYNCCCMSNQPLYRHDYYNIGTIRMVYQAIRYMRSILA